MRRPLIVLAVAATAVLALAACGSTSGNGDGRGDSNGMPGMTHSTAAGTTASAVASGEHNGIDVTFAQSMIPHHQQAVDMANLAAGRGTNAKVTQLAQRIAGAQQPEITTMTGWLKTWGAAPAMQPNMSDMPGMNHSSPGMMTDQEMRQLTTASGTDFDRLFLQLMTRHHEGAIQMATTEQTSGKNAGATALAKQIITAQTAEITEMQQLTSQP
jgi:uncharacterized protein (DUF305 family)